MRGLCSLQHKENTMDWTMIGCAVTTLSFGYAAFRNLKADSDKKFEAIDKKFDAIDKRFDMVLAEMKEIRMDIYKLDMRLSKLEWRFEQTPIDFRSRRRR